MGLIDNLKGAASNAMDNAQDALESVQETASEATQQVADTAGQVADTVTGGTEEAAAAARAQFERFAGDTTALARQAALAPQAALSEVGGEVKELLGGVGDSLSNAGRRLESAADSARDTLSTGVRDGLRSARQKAENLGRELGEVKDDVARRVQDVGRRAVETGREGLSAVERGVDDLKRRAGQLKDDVVQRGGQLLDDAKVAANEIVQDGRDLLNRVEGELDPGTHVARLDSEGDSVKIRLGGFAQAQIEGVPVRGQAQGEMEIKKTADGYEVEISGAVGLGVYAHASGEGTEAGANAMLTGGAKVTMKFATQEEAARAARIAGRMAAVGAAGAAAGPLGSTGAQALIGPSDDDMRFMSDHLGSVELRGGLAAEVSGQLGENFKSLSGKLGGSADVGVRLTFPSRDPATGQVTGPKVTVFGEGSFSGEGEGILGVAVRAGVEGKVTFEREFQLPASVTGRALREDPAGTLRAAANGVKAGNPTLKIEGQVRGTAGAGVANDFVKGHAGHGGGARFELNLTAPRDELLNAAGRMVQGDLRGGLSSLDRATTVTGEYGTFRNTDVALAPEIKDKKTGQGVGVDAQYRLHDRGQQTKIPAQRPSQALRSLEDMVRRAQRDGLIAA